MRNNFERSVSAASSSQLKSVSNATPKFAFDQFKAGQEASLFSLSSMRAYDEQDNSMGETEKSLLNKMVSQQDSNCSSLRVISE